MYRQMLVGKHCRALQISSTAYMTSAVVQTLQTLPTPRGVGRFNVNPPPPSFNRSCLIYKSSTIMTTDFQDRDVLNPLFIWLDRKNNAFVLSQRSEPMAKRVATVLWMFFVLFVQSCLHRKSEELIIIHQKHIRNYYSLPSAYDNLI